MGKRDPRVDAYIAKSAGFAQPILNHLRELVHRGCPEVEETLKWSMPSFVYKGLLCGMAAFKQHATFGFWKHELVFGKTGEKEGMGQFGRITSLKDLPAQKVLLGYIRKAVALNEAGIKAPASTRPKPGEKRALAVPQYLVAALKKNKTAQANFENFSYSHKKEYVEWLTGAKREDTRQKRLQTALAWISEGKLQNWKYIRA
ncbi:MAG: YdeI/OmpD-associated family protein [Verrucomicrobia bacterium]|nr:YdeI/OmpD-associated family protein [Verrucomicrobiota bacterium]